MYIKLTVTSTQICVVKILKPLVVMERRLNTQNSFTEIYVQKIQAVLPYDLLEPDVPSNGIDPDMTHLHFFRGPYVKSCRDTLTKRQ